LFALAGDFLSSEGLEAEHPCTYAMLQSSEGLEERLRRDILVALLHVQHSIGTAPNMLVEECEVELVDDIQAYKRVTVMVLQSD
jgi:hypothetical protein